MGNKACTTNLCGFGSNSQNICTADVNLSGDDKGDIILNTGQDVKPNCTEGNKKEYDEWGEIIVTKDNNIFRHTSLSTMRNSNIRTFDTDYLFVDTASEDKSVVSVISQCAI
ncbi:unnamed protein product [Moneuplotes crassus]|uniref:Uncharacterized protein n=1 Tax=Euplotes crassus TaxID=5936 RepID=A0AAD2D3V0_EUPCR|nr:unnamed protein product [Moneuplotes crassus]